jgi:hypothetical protein
MPIPSADPSLNELVLSGGAEVSMLPPIIDRKGGQCHSRLLSIVYIHGPMYVKYDSALPYRDS